MSGRIEEHPRAEGPALVDGGEPGLPAVLVLDAAGAGKHGEPPASWQELEPSAHVTWLRLPAADAAVATARERFAELAADGRVHVVAGGEAAQLAELLAVERPDALRSVLLVDPPAEPSAGLVDRGTTVVEQALLAFRTTTLQDVLAGHGVPLHVISYRDAGRAEHGPPLPLGHPYVVDTVRRLLTGEPPLRHEEPDGPGAAAPAGTTAAPAAEVAPPAAHPQHAASADRGDGHAGRAGSRGLVGLGQRGWHRMRGMVTRPRA